ncbi:hypothetical protein FB45DRAFT_916155 [Roridomyces roridus]|uniref:Enhancer of polycomb-like protein n=1 Tax=Roridomyces roridus TaxID=1738132 RepID=A0AAD7FP44_9AGAR|nr:hypothetical protein FB45DRAFT_916155 [Roridomyces roridus]
MAPRIPPPKKNRARCGVKYALRIIKGDLVGSEAPEDYDDDPEESQSLMVADVDIHEGREHHLVDALSANLTIPTPKTFTNTVSNYQELYPANKWKDPVSYLQTTRTVEESCTNGLLDHQYTYYIDEIDAQWLDKNNQDARGEGTSAQGANTKYKQAEMGVPFSISQDEFELVMGLFEMFTDQQQVVACICYTALQLNVPLSGRRGLCVLRMFLFGTLVPKYVFVSCTPAWIPAPALLLRIARTVFSHWKYRRSLVQGRLQPGLNHDESDFLNESYVCFRRRDNKPVRKTRAGQLVNHAEKLAQLDLNLSQALDIAKALLNRETLKESFAAQSQSVWNVRKSLVDLISTSPSLHNKADESILIEKPKKKRTTKPSLPKVKVVLPSTPGFSAAARCAEVQQEIIRSVHEESLKHQHHVDAVDDPYQAPFVPRAEKHWFPLRPEDEKRVRDGGSPCSPGFNTPLPLLREQSDDEEEEDMIRRLESRWRFDADDSPPLEQPRELVDEYDTKFLVARLTGNTNKEALLITDAAIVLPPGSDGRERTVLPFLLNAASVADTLGKQCMPYIKERWGLDVLIPPTSSHQRPLPYSRPTAAQPIPRSPSVSTPAPRMQENIPVPSSHTSVPRPSPRSYITNPALPRNPNPIGMAPPRDADKPAGALVRSPSHPLQNNGVRTAIPAHVASASRVTRPSPLAVES